MNPKAERTFLFFLTLFLVVMLISNIVNLLIDGRTANPLMIACFAGGLVCTVIAWIQHFHGKKDDE